MTSNNNAQLVRRVLGLSWPRRFLLTVFVLVGVVGAVQIVVAVAQAAAALAPGFLRKRLGQHGSR
jgi:hypothetical protein